MRMIEKAMFVDVDLSFNHLKAELARIDVLIRREVRRWQLAGQDPNDVYRGLYLSDAEAEALLNQPLGTSWGQSASLEPVEADYFAQAEAKVEAEVKEIIEAARSQNIPVRLLALASVFALDRFELDTLLICLAPTFDLRYEQLYGYLQDNLNRKRPSINLILNLLCGPGPERLRYLSYFAETGPLNCHQLLKVIPESGPGEPPLLRQSFALDPTVAAWLLNGTYRPHPDLGTSAHLLPPEVNDTDHLLVAAMLPALESAVSKQAILAFYGPDRLSQEAAAHLLAVQVRQPLLQIDLTVTASEEQSPGQALRRTLRDARLTGAIPCLLGWNTVLTDGAPPPSLLAELCAFPSSVIVIGRERWQAGGLDRRRPLHWLEFPSPTYAQRQVLWLHFLNQSDELPDFKPDPGSVNELNLIALAGQFNLNSDQIRDAVIAAKDLASQRGDLLKNDDLFSAARTHSNPRLETLARKIAPRYEWTDLILPDDQLAILRELVATVRERPRVLNDWGVGKKLASSAGVTALFAGPPGTGKTMAAEVIAGELGLDLYKIDLSSLVSKYIGETEKNLERIFTEAQSSNAILFFDEADAIFGKRSEVRDAHDRYANIEISYLLQRMEAYDGITILATNLRANLDEAFTRRLHFAVDFPFPDAADRRRIWQTLFPLETPRAADLDFGLLAHRFELAGGNIRNILVSAAYLAAADGGQVTMDHLLHGTRRELQKMGRLVELPG
ncbi:MAG: hypothetical protein DPW09_21045 [Anaerolineae bacterium]|nr:hypothetical protein [Anaerolineae bacterium]